MFPPWKGILPPGFAYFLITSSWWEAFFMFLYLWNTELPSPSFGCLPLFYQNEGEENPQSLWLTKPRKAKNSIDVSCELWSDTRKWNFSYHHREHSSPGCHRRASLCQRGEAAGLAMTCGALPPSHPQQQMAERIHHWACESQEGRKGKGKGRREGER